MNYSMYNEIKQRGTFYFPIEYHYIDRYHPKYHMSAHWHIEYEIIHIRQGSLTIWLDKEMIKASKGDILFIRDGVIHYAEPADCIYECIVFDLNLLVKDNFYGSNLISDILHHKYIVHNYIPSTHKDIHILITSLFTILSSPSAGYELISVGLLFQFFGRIFNHHLFSKDSLLRTKDLKQIAQLKEVLNVIDLNYKEHLTLDILSSTIHMSPKYFCRFFYRMTQKTPIDYLNSYRIERASSLLLSNSSSVTDIAYECGFNDLSHFIRVFKKYKHTTPGKYAKEKELPTL